MKNYFENFILGIIGAILVPIFLMFIVFALCMAIGIVLLISFIIPLILIAYSITGRDIGEVIKVNGRGI